MLGLMNYKQFATAEVVFRSVTKLYRDERQSDGLKCPQIWFDDKHLHNTTLLSMTGLFVMFHFVF